MGITYNKNLKFNVLVPSYRLKEMLAEVVSETVCKELGPILDIHANRISQSESSFRTDKKVRFLLLFFFSRATDQQYRLQFNVYLASAD